MRAGRYDIYIEQGTEFKRRFQVLDSDGQAVDLTNKFIRLYMRQSKWATNAFGKYDIASSNNPYIYLGDESGQFYFYLAAGETHYLDWFVTAFYDIELTPFTANNEVISATDKVGDVTFTDGGGSTVSNAVVPSWIGAGTPTPVTSAPATDDCDLVVEIDDTSGSPHKFKWSIDGGSSWEETLVDIPAGLTYDLAAGAVDTGIRLTFVGQTGFTVGDKWECYTFGTNTWELFQQNDDNALGEVRPASANGQACKPFRNLSWLSTPLFIPNWDSNATADNYWTGGTFVEEVSLSGELTAIDLDYWQWYLWFEVQIEDQGTGDDAQDPQHFRWRTTGGGSGTYMNLIADGHGPYSGDEIGWNATGVEITGNPQHLHGGFYIDFGATTGFQQYSRFTFNSQWPIISLVSCTDTDNNALYRLRRITNDGEGLEFTRILQGAYTASDSACRVKLVVFQEDNTERILEGKVTVSRQITHDVILPIDPYPTYIA